jgi:hypothetical protein
LFYSFGFLNSEVNAYERIMGYGNYGGFVQHAWTKHLASSIITKTVLLTIPQGNFRGFGYGWPHQPHHPHGSRGGSAISKGQNSSIFFFFCLVAMGWPNYSSWDGSATPNWSRRWLRFLIFIFFLYCATC